MPMVSISLPVDNKTFGFGRDGVVPIRNYKKKGAAETFGTWDDELETISYEITIETGEQTTMKFKCFLIDVFDFYYYLCAILKKNN